MPVSKKILFEIETKLGVTVNQTYPVSGGSINQVYRLQTSSGNMLLKINSLYKYPGMFKLEKEGLAAIRSTKTIAVPDILLLGEEGTYSYLLMEWIAPGHATHKTSQTLGKQLAQMHRHTVPNFGFTTGNYMGSLAQSNKWHDSWNSFFIEERLKPMVAIAVEKQVIDSKDVQMFEKLYQVLPELFAEEPPALVHGDLWSGNYLIGANQMPYLIDPAVSYSNREFDIAMTTLFGGFDPVFYDAYNYGFPLQKGWRQRLKLWNLYPLLLHVNLFGGSYVAAVRQSLTAFV
jgi:fructosamine-3-kinase